MNRDQVSSPKRQIFRVCGGAILWTAFVVGATGCQNPFKKAVRDAQYSAYELVGVQKRDLLKDRVEDAREEQKEAGEEFGDALERLKAVYAFEGGALEKEYSRLKSSYDSSAEQADEVRKSIRKVEEVAGDLFVEWEKEIAQIETRELKNRSRQTLSETKQRYEKLHAALKNSERRMDPVLKKFNDQVLYLKHNLNAQAIASLRSESVSIQKDIEGLVAEMKRSIASAEKFIETL